MVEQGADGVGSKRDELSAVFARAKPSIAAKSIDGGPRSVKDAQ